MITGVGFLAKTSNDVAACAPAVAFKTRGHEIMHRLSWSISAPTRIESQLGCFRSSLPDVPGIEHVCVDTLHGVLKHQRPGADRKVDRPPPSSLRKFDDIFVD